MSVDIGKGSHQLEQMPRAMDNVWPSADHAEQSLASWDGMGLEGGRKMVAAYEAVVVELTGGEALESAEVQRIFTLVTKGLGGVASLRKARRPDPDEARVVRRLELRLQNAATSLLARVRGEVEANTMRAQS